MSNGKAEYLSAVGACIKASHIRMLEYDFKHLDTQSYNLTNPISQPFKIIIDKHSSELSDLGNT